ncbi:Probable auxin efflux carrier component 5b [Zea mays]|uniref:Auxin efflux carrier component n=1 Tax=Zea mays TaxID=4577 RepID=B4FSJ4_MAIZE|nr:Probable auxin efflux carrier component 5b [Zea mays]ACF85087.1 unknown [Zea mays]AFK32345.1 putative auxin efflux carrier PIN5c [Zea mays]ONM22747.1 PIN-formed protein11 [Zea mays]|eukprot:NP_001140977.1 putative auxin efflux carrier PIN5c [Zea mays]
MIGWGDVYKVVAAMAPLYFALGLGYGSVRWWKLFSPDQCDAVNRLVAYFAVPFFAFDFAARIDPFALSYRVLAADALSKLAVALALAAWATAAASASARRGGGGKGKDRALSWCITGFSLATLNNTLVVGVPLLDAMYGKWARDLIVQISVVQIIVYFPALLLALEARRAGKLAVVAEEAAGDADESGGGGSGGGTTAAQSLWPLVTAVWKKVARNPNVYAGILGVSWACVTNRWHIETPSIIEGSVLVMSKTGVGLSMFSMGLFMALQEKVIVCGAWPTVLGMALRFVAGPAATAAGAVALGLRGDVLRLAVMQAALPQSITTFVFAREYGLHPEVLSTAVIFGTLASLPVLIVYYIVLGLIRC